MANTTFFWTLGVYLIQKAVKGEASFNSEATLKKVFSPPLLGFMVGLFWYCCTSRCLTF